MDRQNWSLFEGVRLSVETFLGICSQRHRSALQQLAQVDGPALVDLIHRTISENYALCGSSTRKNRSRQNWRWQSLQPQISAHNRSPEVGLERAIAQACAELGRTDWANQIPVASGLVEGSADGRRAIDLVRKHGNRHFEFIELKVGSDTPLYAAIELIEYASLFLIARRDRPGRPCELLDADHVDLRVLAPLGYYSRYALGHLQDQLNRGVALLGEREGIVLSFAFASLHERIALPLPEPNELLDLLNVSGAVS